ncbi:anthranilate synthase component I [Alkalibacterium sp. f15]|uniref:anthranilate synthase component I n=1 Tax=Alkalibacterium sp. f15 TaxID=3414029 RepID=UPI003BF773C2
MSIQYKTKQINGDMLTPISVFQRLNGKKKFILESSSGHGEKGRYSFIGMDPYKEIVGNEQVVTVIEDSQEETFHKKPLEVVKAHIPQVSLDLPFPFYGGAVGYIGYDAIREYEKIGERLKDEIDMPDIHLMFYQELVVFDHKKQEVTIVALAIEGIENLDQRIRTIEEMIQQPVEEKMSELTPLEFSTSHDKESFMKLVKKAKEHIVEGDIFQVVLSQRMKATFEVDPFTFYRKLRVANPSPYMFFVDFQEYIVLGASPESLIKVTGDKVVTNPIAGTRPRGETVEADDAYAEELLSDEKECAEHRMLVDLSRNDLGRVSQIGSISIDKYMTIERFQHVMHIVSEVSGTLADGLTGLDALTTTLPAGTVSGAPKIRAMQIVNELEDNLRGVYSGSIGYINLNGDLDLALAIRTMVIKDNLAYVQAGAGIVYDSDPATEYQETLNKAKSLLEVGQK